MSFNFVIFRDKLYAFANNINDHGIEIWVSEDGQHFTQIEKGGFGDAANNWAEGFVFNDHLIVVVSGAASGPQIWVSDDGLTFRQTVSGGLGDKGNTGFLDVRVTRSRSWTASSTSGRRTRAPVERSGGRRMGCNGSASPTRDLSEARTPASIRFSCSTVSSTRSACPAGGLDKLKGLEVYRSADGTTWQKVVTDGFGQGKERNVTGTLVEFKGRLYLTTNTMDPRILMPGHPTERLAPRGFQLWVSDDGAKWTQVGKDGFGASTTLYADMNVIGDTAYLSAFDYHKGSQLWRSTDGQDWELIYREPDPSFFSMGGGAIDFKDHLIWMDHDLANGLEIWRSDAASGESQPSRP